MWIISLLALVVQIIMCYYTIKSTKRSYDQTEKHCHEAIEREIKEQKNKAEIARQECRPLFAFKCIQIVPDDKYLVFEIDFVNKGQGTAMSISTNFKFNSNPGKYKVENVIRRYSDGNVVNVGEIYACVWAANLEDTFIPEMPVELTYSDVQKNQYKQKFLLDLYLSKSHMEGVVKSMSEPELIK